MEKFLLIFISLFIFSNVAYSVEADDSIDEIIKKQYNTTSSENSKLPSLPKTSPKSIESKNYFDIGGSIQQSKTQSQSNNSNNSNIVNVPKIPQKNTKSFKVNRWRKVNAKLLTPVSDYSKVGKQVSFVTLEPLYSKSFEIPKGTKITGTVVKTHSPQFLGNGGLVSVKTENISYKGYQSYFDGNIVNLNHKHIFLNNIKGKNGYGKGVSKAMKPGITFYNKSLNLTKKMWNGPFAIVSPLVCIPGVVFIAADGVVSPFIAVFSKGERIYVPQGTQVTIKLVSPSFVEY